ncbi:MULTISPECIES: MgtC/SapB family protein [Vibrio]|uniref:Protein MgtC n=1 Tax=Vibrio qingdaonensis TaxID=2829491 RepID=A0A9X3CTC4_9VIBR|nr:MgtC/SapB family protein [Vibrio qingdaonensis]MCW8349156.1 MgtC/SapB family protein [Vibrio qingdaonensis]
MIISELTTFLLPLMVASVLGATVGVERQWHQRMAGLRTNALVSLGAASFTLMSTLEVNDASPTRIAAQVVSGIGFLGAGVIMKEGANIRGLNTAATLWCSAAIGVMAGVGQNTGAFTVALMVLATNTLLRPLVSAINQRPNLHTQQDESWWRYHVEVMCHHQEEPYVRALLLQGASDGILQLQKLDSESIQGEEVSQVRVYSSILVNKRTDHNIEKIVGRLSLEPSVSSACWQVSEA